MGLNETRKRFADRENGMCKSLEAEKDKRYVASSESSNGRSTDSPDLSILRVT